MLCNMRRLAQSFAYPALPVESLVFHQLYLTLFHPGLADVFIVGFQYGSRDLLTLIPEQDL